MKSWAAGYGQTEEKKKKKKKNKKAKRRDALWVWGPLLRE